MDKVRLDDMRIFARVVELESFTRAATRLGMPKQTVSRRIAALEEAVGQRLLARTTRSVRPTPLGAAYAERCSEVVRLADEAHDVLAAESTTVRGTLRVTADPHFGEVFLPPLLSSFLGDHPEVGLDLVLTQRRVDLVEEGFDVGFRIGPLRDSALVGRRLGPAAMTYCASPGYLAVRGTPTDPASLSEHACIALAPEGTSLRWAFAGPDGGVLWQAIESRLRVNHPAVARALAIEGLGIANLPTFACADELRAGRLVSVLPDHTRPFGGIWIVLPTRRHVPTRVRRFVDTATAAFVF